MVTRIPVCFVEEIRRESRLCSKVGRLGVPGKCWQHPQAESTFARNQSEGWNLHKSILHRMPAVMLLRNYGCVTD